MEKVFNIPHDKIEELVSLAKQEVLHDINFNVRAGEKVAILGPNGAGKSTSFNIITAAIPKTSGSVQLFQK